MKPTTEQLNRAVRKLGILKFFPSGADERETILEILDSMVGTVEQLVWLVSAMINGVSEWPGPAQMRAIFSTQFECADGIRGPECTVPGFTPWEIYRPVEIPGVRETLRMLAPPKELPPPPTPEELARSAEMIKTITAAVETCKVKKIPRPTRQDKDYCDNLLRGVGA